MTQAVFISYTAAILAARQAAVKAGMTESYAKEKAYAHRKYFLGQMLGYTAWYPTGYGHAPVLEV